MPASSPPPQVPRLRTERLILRPLVEEDLDGLMAIFSDPVAMRFYLATKERQEAARWIRRSRELHETRGLGFRAVLLAGEDRFVGLAGLLPQVVEGTPELEIGYLFVRAFWGRGLATEAARACRDHGFEDHAADRLISLIRPANEASWRVAERVGMHRGRIVEHARMAHFVYAIERRDPRPRARSRLL